MVRPRAIAYDTIVSRSLHQLRATRRKDMHNMPLNAAQSQRMSPQNGINRTLSRGHCWGLKTNFTRCGHCKDTAWYLRKLLPEQDQVDYLSAIGTDGASDQTLDLLANAGLGTKAMFRRSGKTVGLYMIQLKDGERSFSYWREISAAGGEVVFNRNLRPKLWADIAPKRSHRSSIQRRLATRSMRDISGDASWGKLPTRRSAQRPSWQRMLSRIAVPWFCRNLIARCPISARAYGITTPENFRNAPFQGPMARHVAPFGIGQSIRSVDGLPQPSRLRTPLAIRAVSDQSGRDSPALWAALAKSRRLL